MGVSPSSLYGHCRRLLIRYNAENRAHKFLDKGQLPVAPRHPLPERISEKLAKTMLSKEQLEDIHCKNKQLDEHLKKVYLTSTSEITGTPSTKPRPKPKKENEVLKTVMFLDPKNPSPGHCTLTTVIEILSKYQKNTEHSNYISSAAFQYKLDKKDVGNLLLYHSIFILEKLDFMNAKPPESDEEKPEKIEFEVYNRLEQKPLRQIEGGKK